MKLDLDKINSVSAYQMWLGCFEIISALQRLPPETQVLAISAMTILTSEKYSMNIRDGLEHAEKRFSDSLERFPETKQAVLMYVQGEL